MKKRLTTEKFIEKAKEIHGNTYDYSRSIYVRNDEPIEIVCIEHGPFFTKPISHSSGSGCPKCGRDKTTRHLRESRGKKLKELLSKIEGPKYSFPNIDKEYQSYKSEITVICEDHGGFKRKVKSCVFNGVCPKCSIVKRSNIRRYSLEELKQILERNYGDRFEYPYLSKEYKNNKSKITIRCPKHGEFINVVGPWLISDGGCSRCRGDNMSENTSMTFSDFITRSNLKYNYKYSYCLVKWEKESRNRKEPIKIICPKHGVFKQSISDHLNGCKIGCPACTSNTDSLFEREIRKYIESLGIEVESRDRKTISPLELDILIPSQKIAIECNGLYYHRADVKGRNYHKDKREKCEKVGFRLIQIWENEWIENRDKVKRYLKNTLNKDSRRIFARKCSIGKPTKEEAIKILSENHLIGIGSTNCDYVGLYFEKELVCLMAFKNGFNGVELHRYINSSDTVVVGGFSKCLNHYVKTCRVGKIVSYIDLDKFVGDSYLKAGFVKDKLSLTMFYSKGLKTFSKFGFRRKHLKSWDNYSKDKTERIICAESGYYQCFNSGTLRVILYLDKFRL